MARQPRVRRGFTLVEMLVVITIIGTLAAILLPAVQAAREAGRRTTCLNNIKQVSVATANFESSFNRLPGYQDFVCKPYFPTELQQGPSRGRKVSWMVLLLPYLEQQTLYDDWNEVGEPNSTPPYLTPNTPYDPTQPSRLAKYVESFLCPSDISLDSEVPGLSYVANAGASIDWLVGATSFTKQNRADGLFYDFFDDAHEAYDNASVKITSDGIKDGASNTLAYSETLHESKMDPVSGVYFNVWHATERTDDATILPRRWSVFVYQPDPTAVPQGARINQNRYDGKVLNAPGGDRWARPASKHPGGVIVAFAGGNNRFLRENIDYLVYQRLMMSDDRKSTLAELAKQGQGPWGPPNNYHALPALSSGEYE